MQYLIHAPDGARHLAGLESRLRDDDPAALVDFDDYKKVLRLSTSLSVDRVTRLAALAGLALAPDQVEIVRSECCGGCGG